MTAPGFAVRNARMPPGKKRGVKRAKKDAGATSPAAKAAPRRSGGAAAAGGFKFQDAITAIAGAHLAAGVKLGWLSGLANDVPVTIDAETGGAGDDIGITLENGDYVEVQAKKGLQKGPDFWAALLKLAGGLAAGDIDYGLLAVSPDASSTIREDLANDIERISGGRTDDLKEISGEFLTKLKAAQHDHLAICQRLRIRVLSALPVQNGDEKAALQLLRNICAASSDAERAWEVLGKDAGDLVARRRRWNAQSLATLMSSNGIALHQDRSVSGLLQQLMQWNASTNADFPLPGWQTRLPLGALLPMRAIRVAYTPSAASQQDALESYRSAGVSSAIDDLFAGQHIARFHWRSVVSAGAGLGKSTLMKALASAYAKSGIPVLKVNLKTVDAAVLAGRPFEDAIFEHGLDGSNVRPAGFRGAPCEWLLLADGLDDCGSRRASVAEMIRNFAAGHRQARIVVTTRPIGYDTAALADWRHYVLLAPDKDAGANNLAQLVTAGGKPFTDKDAKAALANTTAAAAIVTSPLLLAMAASLLLSGETLPSSKGKLYEAMLRLHARSKSVAQPTGVSTAILDRIFNLLGRKLQDTPAAGAQDLIKRCAAEIAPELGKTALAATSDVEAALHYWERLGLIEKLHHSDGELFGFTHKTFGEFAAARFVAGLQADVRRATIEAMLSTPAQAEVFSFVGGLGHGDLIVDILTSGREDARVDGLHRALALLDDADADVSVRGANALVAHAFAFIDQGDQDEIFVIGEALADLAERRPELVGPSAQARLQSDDVRTALIATACAVASGTPYAPPDVRDTYARLRAAIPLPPHPTLLTPRAPASQRVGAERDLLQRLAFAVLKSLPNDAAQHFVDTAIDDELMNTGFMLEIDAHLVSLGLKEPERLFRDKFSMGFLYQLMKPPAEWDAARLEAFTALATAMAIGEDDADDAGDTQRPLVHFAAFIQRTRFFDIEVGDIQNWTDAFDPAPLRAVVQAFRDRLGLDAVELTLDAAALRAMLDADPTCSPFRLLPMVDGPELDKEAIYDRALVRKAFAHPSRWVRWLASRLLGESEPDAPASAH